MNDRLHTIIGGRHYPHKNNTPKPGWLEAVNKNAKAIEKGNVPDWVINAKSLWSDQARTIGTSIEIANSLSVRINNFQIRDWLSIKPQKSPANVKEILKKLDVHYEADPSVKANGYSDELIYKIQRNTLPDVDVSPFARFTANKLYNAIQAIKRNPEASNLTIAWIHGGRWLETVLYTLWWENLPAAWEGQLRMSEVFAMHIDKDPEADDKVVLVVNYRGESHTIKEDEIKEKIDALKS